MDSPRPKMNQRTGIMLLARLLEDPVPLETRLNDMPLREDDEDADELGVNN